LKQSLLRLRVQLIQYMRQAEYINRLKTEDHLIPHQMQRSLLAAGDVALITYMDDQRRMVTH
jgi:hypothetical protein